MSAGPAISSTQNPRFKAARALREARERRRQGRFLVDGAREIERAIGAGLRPIEAWVAPERLHSDELEAAVRRLAAAGADLVEVPPDLLAKLAYGERDDGVVAVMAAPERRLDSLELPAEPLVAVVDGVEKPGNLGALVRSADGAGVDAVLVTDGIGDLWNPNAIRASLGTIFALPIAACPAAEALAFVRARDVAVVTARVDAADDYDAVDLSGPVAIVVGSERSGLDETWTGPDIRPVRIPMLGTADSLNVSASGAVLFYEARRQRRVAASGWPPATIPPGGDG